MFYIVCAIAVGVAFFLTTSAFILGGTFAGLMASFICAPACVFWLGEAYTMWCEDD